MRAIYCDVDYVDRISMLLVGNGMSFITPLSWRDLDSARNSMDSAFDENIIDRRMSVNFMIDNGFPKNCRWDESFIGVECYSLDDARCLAMEISSGAYFFAAFGGLWRGMRDSFISSLLTPTYENEYLGESQKGHDAIRAVFIKYKDFFSSMDGYQVWLLSDVTGQESELGKFIITGGSDSLNEVYNLILNAKNKFKTDMGFSGAGKFKFIDLPEWISEWPSVIDRKFDINHIL